MNKNDQIQSFIQQAKQNKTALIIFALGLILFLLVIIYAIQTLSGSSSSGNSSLTQEEVNEFKQNTQNPATPQDSNPTEQKNIKRQKNIRENDITGAWDSNSIKGARTLLQLQNGTFRIIMVYQNDPLFRRYMNGTYSLQQDILTLTPDNRSAPPSDKYRYQIMTRAPLPVQVSKHKGRMIWSIPGDDAGIYVPNSHALLDDAAEGIAVWGPLK